MNFLWKSKLPDDWRTRENDPVFLGEKLIGGQHCGFVVAGGMQGKSRLVLLDIGKEFGVLIEARRTSLALGKGSE